MDQQARIEAVLGLHHAVEIEPSDTICGECSFRLPNGRYFGKLVEWPCPTVELLTLDQSDGEDELAPGECTGAGDCEHPMDRPTADQSVRRFCDATRDDEYGDGLACFLSAAHEGQHAWTRYAALPSGHPHRECIANQSIGGGG